jgi:hypothetical protein
MLLELNSPSGMVGQEVDIIRASSCFQIVGHADQLRNPEFAEPRATRRRVILSTSPVYSYLSPPWKLLLRLQGKDM